jgi:hypothetical protein
MHRLGVRLVIASTAAACALPHLRGDPVHEQRYARAGTASSDSTRDSSLIVQLREFDRSAAVTVLAWDADDASYGVRATVSRNGGTLVGQPRSGNHELYLDPVMVQHMGGFRLAGVLPGPPLVPAPPMRDVYSCSYGSHCSPMTALGVWIPDSVLRAHQDRGDSLVVTFTPALGRDWEVTLSGDLIGRYLHAVDSVSASLARGERSAQN